jgi:serine/threonine-protein kinase HipA
VKRSVEVWWGANAIGLLHHDRQAARESSSFEYSAAWLRDPNRFAIEPSLRLVTGPQYHRKPRDGSAFHGAIADTEPDGWGRRVILRDHAKQREHARRMGRPIEARALDDLDFLLAVDDASRVGALRFRDADGVFHRATEPGRRAAPPVIELATLFAATRAVETNTETLADLAYLRGRGTSLGGLRPKCTIVDDVGRISLGKFPSIADERAVTKGEVLALRLAARAGITAAEARLVDADATPVAVIRRFDRTDDGARIGYISAATLLGVDPSDGADHAYTEIVDALRVHGADVPRDLEELWRRIAFSILITNVDDHLLNLGFLATPDGRWRLSPAFDINPFPDRVRELKTWISEETGPEATISALLSVRAYFQLRARRCAQILGEVEAAVAKWREEGRALGMTEEELDAFDNAFEHAERTAARAASS